MNDLIQRLVAAIIRQEGMKPDYTNPGNLRDCPWFPEGSGQRVGMMHIRNYPANGEPVKYANGFWIPRTRAEGVAGAAHVVALHVAQGDSLRKLISIWAPPSDHNDTQAYIEHVSQWAAIPNVEIPLWTYLTDPVT